MALWVKDLALPLMAWVTAMVQVQSLAQEFPHATGVAKIQKRKKKKKERKGSPKFRKWPPCSVISI